MDKILVTFKQDGQINVVDRAALVWIILNGEANTGLSTAGGVTIDSSVSDGFTISDAGMSCHKAEGNRFAGGDGASPGNLVTALISAAGTLEPLGKGNIRGQRVS